MAVARRSTAQLANVLGSAIAGNAPAALRSIGLERLAGRPIEEIFLGIMEVICPDGGAIDDSIAREAFVETIVDLAENGITDFDVLTAEQVQTILELNVAHAIEARICNDIGAHAISMPQDAKEAADIQAQLFEFVETGRHGRLRDESNSVGYDYPGPGDAYHRCDLRAKLLHSPKHGGNGG